MSLSHIVQDAELAELHPYARAAARLLIRRYPVLENQRDDVHQEAYVAMLKAVTDYKAHGHPIRPVEIFVYYRCLDHLKHLLRYGNAFRLRFCEELNDGYVEPSHVPMPEPSIFCDKLLGAAKLTDLQRDLIWKHFWEGRDLEEIAKARGIGRKKVSVMKKLAISNIRAVIGMPPIPLVRSFEYSQTRGARCWRRRAKGLPPTNAGRSEAAKKMNAQRKAIRIASSVLTQ